MRTGALSCGATRLTTAKAGLQLSAAIHQSGCARLRAAGFEGHAATLESNPFVVLALEIRELGFQPEELLNWLAARNCHAYSFR
jgi:hypothetical protein